MKKWFASGHIVRRSAQDQISAHKTDEVETAFSPRMPPWAAHSRRLQAGLEPFKIDRADVGSSRQEEPPEVGRVPMQKMVQS